MSCNRATSLKLLSESPNSEKHNIKPTLSLKVSEKVTRNEACSEYNILILGETGSGKSTTINALANYLKFSSFDEASKVKEFLNLIPSKFSLPDPKTGESTVIEDSKQHENEQQEEDGAARTQSPWGYVFWFGNRVVRLIDTPGLNDTRGIEKDKENFDKILYYLRHHRTLHGIIVLVKATDTRLTAPFQYCLSELFTHLHRDACRNMIFCFTHSRNAFYEPSEGYSTVQAFLNKTDFGKNLQLKPRENCYFIDNEAYRFLVAKKFGYPFSDQKILSFRESWDKSVAQAEKLMLRFIEMKPHDLENTTLLDSVRKLMKSLAEPMVDIQKTANENIDKLKSKLTQLKFNRKNAISKDVELFDAVLDPLAFPQLVCTAEKCVKKIEVELGVVKDVFKTRCHKKCKIDGVETNLIGDPKIKQCKVFKESDNCTKCGCPWNKHMHLNYKFSKVTSVVLHDMNHEENPDKFVARLLKEYRDELKTIQEIASKFAYILNSNANSAINNYIEPYLNLLIEEERRKQSEHLNYPVKALNSLLDMKEAHRNSVKILREGIENEESLKDSNNKVCIQDVGELRAQLCNLKRTGEQFRKIIHVTMPREFGHPETPIEIF